MWSKLIMTVILGAVGLLAATSDGKSQAACSEGRTASGRCVKPDLAQSMRKSAIIETQAKLSYTSPPLLPSEDRDYYVPPDFQEIISLFASGLTAPRSSGGARRP